MSLRSRPGSDVPADRCAEPRADADAACAEAQLATATYEAAQESARTVRRDLLVARRDQSEASRTADPAKRAAEKDAARDSFRLAKVASGDGGKQREAMADYARSLDRINRETLRAGRALDRADARVQELEVARLEAERAEQSARMRCDGARAACLEARMRLAACEEAGSPEAAPPGVEDGLAVDDVAGGGGPTVMEAVIDGDRGVLELASAQLAARVGWPPAEASRQLVALNAAIGRAAAGAGYLVFDANHDFWSALSAEEARDVVGALGRLGYVYTPTDGWLDGRSPSPSDLAMALAYAGLDPRNMRDLPSADELRALPDSMGVDGRAFIAAEAQGLGLDRLVRALGDEAPELEPLWGQWGQVRSLLLADAHVLAPGTG